mgnify:CR=1 FL=1
MNFTITWQTSLGRFGWITVSGCNHIEDAVDTFMTLRREGVDVPFDATIDTVKPA